MRAPVGFECQGCGVLLDPSFEIGRVECAAGCEADVWACLSCSGKRVRCVACRLAGSAKREAVRERERQAEREAERKRFAERPMSPS